MRGRFCPQVRGPVCFVSAAKIRMKVKGNSVATAGGTFSALGKKPPIVADRLLVILV